MVFMEKKMLKFNKDFIKNYGEDSDKGYILEADVKYPKNLHDLHNDLPFLSERMKIIGLMKDELGGKITIEFLALRPKTYSYLMRDDYDNSDDDNTNKMAKGTKKCVIK